MNRRLQVLRGDPEELARLRDLAFPPGQRRLAGPVGLLVTLACGALTLMTLYMAFTITFGAIETRAFHLAFTIPLTFLLYPAIKGQSRDDAPSPFDWLLALAALGAFLWVFFEASRFEQRFAYYDPIEPLDLVFGVLALVTIFEATRRTIGMTIVILNLIFIVYALTGPYWPGLFEHRGTGVTRLIEHLYMLSDGIFNFIMGIMATFLFTFLTLGAFLRVSGGDRVFTDLALAIAGGRRGGPAKVAIIASALMGTLSGSTVSNVATTGTMTIPLMKRTGFKDYEAGAIETTASLGGALTPPLMGAGVFLMTAFTGVSLLTIMLYSIIPAVLYFLSIYIYVDIKARYKGLAGLPSEMLPGLWDVIRLGGHVFLPIVLLIYLLVIGFTPFYASAACVVATFVISFLRVATALTPAKLVIALEASTRVAVTVSALSASAAIIYGVITATGLLVKVTSIILALSSGSLLIAIVLVGVMSYVLGMGLPVTASYVLIAALGAPALAELGLPILAAHLIIFWFSQDSTITPPICMTAFVAARIAKAPPMRTGWECVKMAKALYVMPFVFAYGSLLSESWVEILFDTLPLAGLFTVLPMVVEGYATRRLLWGHRLLLLPPAFGFMMATVGTSGQGIGWMLGSAAFALVVLGEAHRRNLQPLVAGPALATGALPHSYQTDGDAR